MKDVPGVLFAHDNLDRMLHERARRAVCYIENLPQQQFRVSSDEELLEPVFAAARVEPIELDMESQVVDINETSVEARECGGHDGAADGRACVVRGVKVVVSTPFSGDRSLFSYRPGNFDLFAPSACIRGGTDGDPRPMGIVIEYAIYSARDPDQYRRKADGIISHIKTYLFHVNGQVLAHNQNLPSTLQEAITTRRKELAK